jgi:hypothetical protein
MNRVILLWRKLAGSLRTFGVRDMLRRCAKEATRLFRHRAVGAVDVTEVHVRLLVGAAPRSTAAVQLLSAAGITHVLDLRAERRATDPLARTDVVAVHWIPTYDDWRPKDETFYSAIEEAAQAVWRRSPGARLLVCCGAGEHRGPLGGAVVLADLLGDLDEALRRVAAARPVAEFLPAYEQSLRAYWTARSAA